MYIYSKMGSKNMLLVFQQCCNTSCTFLLFVQDSCSDKGTPGQQFDCKNMNI